MQTPTIFLSAGEPSGDLHAANLIDALRAAQPDFHCVGFAGPKMRAAGCEPLADLTAHAVMWIGEAIARYATFRRLLAQADRWLADHRPQAVVLIDFPGFHWHVARAAKRHGIPVIYYGVPQLWAWAPWRAGKMRRLVDLALCQLPFEPSWFQERGIRAEYVGHPYFDELSRYALDAEYLAAQRLEARPLVTFLPGSRNQEVRGLTPWLWETAARIHAQRPDCRYAWACFDAGHAAQVRRHRPSGLPECEVAVGRTPELIAAASCCIACSGSVSLELLFHCKPAAIVYRVGAIGFVLQDAFRTARYLSLPNLLTSSTITRRPWERVPASERERALYPEYLAVRSPAREVAARVVRWLQSPEARSAAIERIAAAGATWIQPGASTKAALRILDVANSPGDCPAPRRLVSPP